MSSLFRNLLGTAALIAATAVFSSGARAQCSVEVPKFQQQSWHGQASGGLMKVDWRREDNDIVGYWNSVFTSKGTSGIPDGTVLDKGLQQWHGDGTEFLSSSIQKPITGNYCQGTWEKVGASTYALNHFAYTYDVTTQVTNGGVRVQELVTVSRDGSKYTGTFTIDNYDTLRNHMGPRVTGIVTAKRIGLDTTAQEIL